MDQDQRKVDTSAIGNETNPAQTVAEGKGKGKAVDLAPQDVSMGEEDSSSDEETGAEDEVCAAHPRYLSLLDSPLTFSSTGKRRAYGYPRLLTTTRDFSLI